MTVFSIKCSFSVIGTMFHINVHHMLISCHGNAIIPCQWSTKSVYS